MNNLIFEKSNGNLSIEAIKNFEEFYNISFSDDYKNLLLKFNGGIPNKSLFEGADEPLILSELFSLDSGELSVRYSISKFLIEEELIPNYLIPIGSDPADNLICLSQAKETYGYIYLWMFDSIKNLRFVSKSLNEVLENLKEFEW